MKPIIHTFNHPTHPLNPDVTPNYRQEDDEYRLGSWVILYVLVFAPDDAVFKSLADELKVARELIMNWQFELYSHPDCDPTGKGMVLRAKVPAGLSYEAQHLYVYNICYDELSEMLEEEGWEIYARMGGENGDVVMGEGDGDVDMDLGVDMVMVMDIDGDADVDMVL